MNPIGQKFTTKDGKITGTLKNIYGNMVAIVSGNIIHFMTLNDMINNWRMESET